MNCWTPAQKRKISEWASDEYFITVGAKKTKYDVDEAPYQVEPLDCLIDEDKGNVTIMSGVRAGKTTIASIISSYFVKNEPCTIIYYNATEDLAKAYSNEYVRDVFAKSPSLKILVPDSRSKLSYRPQQREFINTAKIYCFSIQSPGATRHYSARMVIMDEVSKYADLPDGDPVELAENRTNNSPDAIHVYISTPTMDGFCRIQELFEQSDQRHYNVKCPHCGGFHTIEFHENDPKKGICWNEDKNSQVLDAWHVCPHCKEKQFHEDKPKLYEDARWVKAKPEVKDHAGFHISALYSPWYSFIKIVEKYKKAKGNYQKLKSFHNEILGLPFKNPISELLARRMMQRREDFSHKKIPNDGVLLTMAVDIQDGWMAYKVTAWGANKEHWILRYGRIEYDVADPRSYVKVHEIWKQPYLHETGATLGIKSLVVDTGDRAPLVRRMIEHLGGEGAGVYGIRGINRPSTSEGIVTFKKVVWEVDTINTKDELFFNLREVDEPGPNFTHFPSHFLEDYFLGLFSEKKVKTPEGKVKYEKHYDRNEPLDLMVYNHAALEILSQVKGMNLNMTVEAFFAQLQGKEGPQKKRKKPRIKRF